KLIYSRVNVLVLDEPTNHLDIPSREALEEALDAYQGTIVTISHDRYFLDRVATQILALDGQGNSEHYDGDYTEYHDWKRAGGHSLADDFPVVPNFEKANETSKPIESQKPKRKPKESAKSATRAVKVVKKQKEGRALGVIESEITETERSLASISQ